MNNRGYKKSFEILTELNELSQSGKTDQLIQELKALLTEEKQHLNKIENILISYRAIILECMIWKSRHVYLEIAKNFSDRIISGQQFSNQFLKIYQKNQKQAYYVETNLQFETELNLSPEMTGFSEVIDIIFDSIELFDTSIDDSQSSSFALSENTLRLIIKDNVIPKIQKYYKKKREISIYTLDALDQLIWETRYEYIELLEEFLNDSSNFLNFKNKYTSSLQWAENLKTSPTIFTRYYQANGFSNFIRILVDLFDSYQKDSNISLNVLKFWTRKIISEMENHYC